MKILAAEDTPSLRALLQLCLERAGHAVDLAENGREAADLFSPGAYDAVILDIQMPVMDGLEAARAMRAAELAAGVAPAMMIALTANTEGADLRRCLEAGFTTTVRKPFGREDLLSALTAAGGASPRPAQRPAVVAPPPPAVVVPPPPPETARILVEADPLYADLIAPFLVNARDESAAMRAAALAGDFGAVAVASHKLVGSGASYGFAGLSEESRRVAAAAKNGDKAEVLARLDALDSYLSRVKVVYA